MNNNIYISYITIPDYNTLKFFEKFPQKTFKEEERQYAIRNEPLFNNIFSISCCNEEGKIITFKLENYSSEKSFLEDFWKKLTRKNENKNLVFYNKQQSSHLYKKSKFYKIETPPPSLVTISDLGIHNGFIQPIEFYTWLLFNDEIFNVNLDEIDKLWLEKEYQVLYEKSEHACLYVRQLNIYFNQKKDENNG